MTMKHVVAHLVVGACIVGPWASAAASAADGPLRFVALIDVAPAVPKETVARIARAVDDWTLPGGPILRVPPDDVAMPATDARGCLARNECRHGLLSRGLAFVVFVEVVPTTDGLSAMRVQAIDTVGGLLRLDGYFEFGKEGPEPHLREVLPHLARSPRGEVAFKLDPPGTRLRLNGWALADGTTHLDHLVPGHYRLRADHDGRMTTTSEFNVGLDEDAPPLVVELILTPLPGSGGDGTGGGKKWLYIGIGAGVVAAVLAGGVALAVALATRGDRCGDPFSCGAW
jgi:hypothetical protein